MVWPREVLRTFEILSIISMVLWRTRNDVTPHRGSNNFIERILGIVTHSSRLRIRVCNSHFHHWGTWGHVCQIGRFIWKNYLSVSALKFTIYVYWGVTSVIPQSRAHIKSLHGGLKLDHFKLYKKHAEFWCKYFRESKNKKIVEYRRCSILCWYFIAGLIE